MEKPTFNYRIWHSPRVGSTLLCQLLEDTGIAGKPGEHVTLHGQNSLSERYGTQDYDELIKKVWRVGMGKNGVFGVKLSHHAYYSEQIMRDLAIRKGIEMPENPEEIWRDFFPDSMNIFLTRLNKIDQVVSWWKAIKDNEWHLYDKKKREIPDAFYEDKYNLDALKFLLSEITLREAATVDHLQKNKLDFITISYEDLIADPGKVLNEILYYLGLTMDPVKTPVFKFHKTANLHSLKWVERLRNDLQKDMDKRIW